MFFGCCCWLHDSPLGVGFWGTLKPPKTEKQKAIGKKRKKSTTKDNSSYSAIASSLANLAISKVDPLLFKLWKSAKVNRPELQVVTQFGSLEIGLQPYINTEHHPHSPTHAPNQPYAVGTRI